MKKTILVALAAALAANVALAARDSRLIASAEKQMALARVAERADEHRLAANYYQRARGAPTWRTSFSYRRSPSIAYRKWVRELWHDRRARARHTFWNDYRVRGLLCIKSGVRDGRRVGHGEGAWTSNTGNGYYGGLQMDMTFQRTYGPELLRSKGTADRWTPLEQIAVGLRAHRSGRGFGPWPSTRIPCGV